MTTTKTKYAFTARAAGARVISERIVRAYPTYAIVELALEGGGYVFARANAVVR
jgi:hypothetical protein